MTEAGKQPAGAETTDGLQAARIVAGLRSAAEALDAGHIEMAAHLLEDVETACGRAGETGERLATEDLMAAQTLQARLLLAAERSREGLVASLLQSARVRTAAHAYKSQT